LKRTREPSKPIGTGVNRVIDTIKLEDYLVSATSRYRNQNDIVVRICESTGWEWDRAVDFYHRTMVKRAADVKQARHKVHAIAAVLLTALGACELLAVATLVAYCARSVGPLNYTCDLIFHGENFLALLIVLVGQGLIAFLTGVVGLLLYVNRLLGVDDSRLTGR